MCVSINSLKEGHELGTENIGHQMKNSNKISQNIKCVYQLVRQKKGGVYKKLNNVK